MKQLFWLALGVVAGFFVAHKVSQTDQGKAFFANVDSKTREFTDALVEGYREREAELRNTRKSS